MSALLVLPLWIGLFCQLKRHFSDWRDVAFAASACWGAGIVLLTEALSALSAISFWPLVIVWSLISLLALAPCVISAPRAPRLAIRAWSSLADPPLSQRILIAGIAFICLATVCVAVISPPNNWDSMTYHMARVANWMDHHSIRHYPAHSLRQLYLGPWAEFTILHLQILSGGDRFAALVQYVAMLGSVIGVSRVAEKLGADRMGQLLASVYCATLPMGILQASSTQNDYVVAFWLICFVNTALDLTGQGLPLSRLKTAIGGLSLGLAALTKMTALLFAAPFAVWIGALLWWRGRIRAVAVLGGMGILAAAINAPHMTRNWRAFESPLGPPTVSRYLNEVHSPAAVASNLIRNLALHAGGLPVGRGIVVAAVKMIHVPLRQDVDDRRTTFIDTRFGLGPALHEDVAGNPLHLLAGWDCGFCVHSFRCRHPAARIRGMHWRWLLPLLCFLEMAAVSLPGYIYPYLSRRGRFAVSWRPCHALEAGAGRGDDPAGGRYFPRNHEVRCVRSHRDPASCFATELRFTLPRDRIYKLRTWRPPPNCYERHPQGSELYVRGTVGSIRCESWFARETPPTVRACRRP